MSPLFAALLIGGLIAGVILFFLAWQWASRVWPLPCPSVVGWALESPLYERITGTETTLSRIGLRPGQRVLEIGPGPGRILIPAARRILPGGEAVGIDIQPGMIERLRSRAAAAGVTNLAAMVGDATQPLVPAGSFDVVLLVTTLGEIPDRQAVLAQCYRVLKPGGVLSISEMLPDPHYQSKRTVQRLAEGAGFWLQSIRGGAWLYTANFVKPAEAPVATQQLPAGAWAPAS
jgi:ubiquinone/menaquinone biosynthesis C-methylase UbiE